MSIVCVDVSYIYYDQVLPIFCITLGVAVLPATYIYARAYQKRDLKETTKAFIASILLYVFTFFKLIFAAINYAFTCHRETVHLVFQQFSLGAGLLQYLAVLLILFYRLYVIFKETQFMISACTVRFFVVVLCFILFLYVAGTIIRFTIHEIIGISISAFGAVVVLLLLFWLNGLFVRKLIAAHKAVSGNVVNHDRLIRTATKIAVLCLVSTASLFIYSILIFIWPSAGSPHWDLIGNIIGMLDVYTNFVCIFLSNRYFDGAYRRLCGCCDRCCYGICSNCFESKHTEQMMSEMSAADTTHDKTETTATTATATSNGE